MFPNKKHQILLTHKKPKFRFDYLNPSISLFISGSKRLSSKIGTIFGIIAYLIILGLSLFFVIDFFSKREVNVLTYSENFDENSTINLRDTLFELRLSNVINQDIDSRMGTVTALFYSYHKGQNNKTQIPLEKCKAKTQADNGIIDKPNNINANTNFYCLGENVDTEKINLALYDTADSGSYMIVFVGECVNSTMNNNSCFDPDVIKEFFLKSQMFFTFNVRTIQVDHFNTTSPFEEAKYTNSIRLTHGFKYMYQFYYRQVKYTTDRGLIFESNTDEIDYYFDSKETEYFIFTEDNEFEVKGSVYQFRFQLDSGSIDRYKRFYPKLPSLLANISAVFKFVSVIGKVIINLLCSSKLYVKLFENINKERGMSKDNDTIHNQSSNCLNTQLHHKSMNTQSLMQKKTQISTISLTDDQQLPKLFKPKINTLIRNKFIKQPDSPLKQRTMTKEKKDKEKTKKNTISYFNYIFASFDICKNEVSKYILFCEKEIKGILSVENVLYEFNRINVYNEQLKERRRSSISNIFHGRDIKEDF